jgi:outer membrane protein OmpA-like peptidoglycan-associated protein
MIKNFLLIGLAVVSLTSQVAAQDILPRDNGIFKYHGSPRWRESESHPLRTVAYVMHPVGWVAREAVYRPFSYFAGSTEFTRSFFGFREPNDIREPLCFFDSDQVPDCRELAPYNSLMKPCEGENCGSKAAINEIVFPDVAFEFDKYTLNDLGKAKARDVAKQLASLPSVKVSVEGHADERGSDEYNMKLGKRRAESVIVELEELGIDKGRMSAISWGESRPLSAEKTEAGYAMNRRVEFRVVGETATASK